MDRKIFIGNNDAELALKNYLALFDEMDWGYDEVAVMDSLGRITYEPLVAKICDPVYNASAMDGIMVIAEHTYEASEVSPLILEKEKDFTHINTGGALTGEYNAVIMIEDVIPIDDDKVKIIMPAVNWQNVRVIGESIVAGEMLLPSKKKITPVDLGAMIAGGYKTVKVFKRPRVGIIPTGAELIENPEEIETGKLMESNSYVFAGLVHEYGGIATRYPIVRDNFQDLKIAINKAVSENEIVLLNAGTSAGTKDFTVHAIEELGKVFMHGLAIKPGKPTVLGVISDKPVLGIPGYPVSAFLMVDKFVKPLVYKFLSQDIHNKTTVEAVSSRRIVSSFKNEEIIRVALGNVNGKMIATPLDRGAAAVMSLVRADGKITVPRLKEGIEAGETVTVELLKPIGEINKTLAIIGSHDLVIDYIADKMKISSAHVGSLAGINSIKKAECHIAPIHLLDEETGEYNTSYVKKYLGTGGVLIRGVKRTQGFMVQKGNPLGITDFSCLTKNLVFANRQRGAGTRVLLDYHLKLNGISRENIKGYDKEFGTHMAVAIAVKTGLCQVGLGIMSAAIAMDLDFIPICSENYDFLTTEENLCDERVETFIKIIKSNEFLRKLDELSGYSYDEIGSVIKC